MPIDDAAKPQPKAMITRNLDTVKETSIRRSSRHYPNTKTTIKPYHTEYDKLHYMTSTKVRYVLNILLALSTAMMVFQLLLSFGAPFGQAAWGGTYRVLPKFLRAQSAMSALLFLCSIIVFRGRVGLHGQPPTIAFFRFGSMLLALLFTLSFLLNLASTSVWEQNVMAPIAFIMAVCGWIIVRQPLAQKHI